MFATYFVGILHFHLFTVYRLYPLPFDVCRLMNDPVVTWYLPSYICILNFFFPCRVSGLCIPSTVFFFLHRLFFSFERTTIPLPTSTLLYSNFGFFFFVIVYAFDSQSMSWTLPAMLLTIRRHLIIYPRMCTFDTKLVTTTNSSNLQICLTFIVWL